MIIAVICALYIGFVAGGIVGIRYKEKRDIKLKEKIRNE